jgi:hypothetical protein
MYNNYNYPPGADTENAPWNSRETTITVPVTVSMTISKTFEVEVTTEEYTEDGYPSLENVDLHQAFEDQYVTPNNLAQFTESLFNADLDLKAAGMPLYLKNAIADCKGWDVDDYVVMEE